jgi:hypothetical protein
MTIMIRAGAILAVATAVGGGVTLHAVASSDDAQQHKSSTQQTLPRHDDNRRDQMSDARDDRVGHRRMHAQVRVIGHVCDAEHGSAGMLPRSDDHGRRMERGDDHGRHMERGDDRVAR